MPPSRPSQSKGLETRRISSPSILSSSSGTLTIVTTGGSVGSSHVNGSTVGTGLGAAGGAQISPGNISHPHHVTQSMEGAQQRRFPSIGGTKKLAAENQTLKAKIAELERYLTGLKEELILAHRQVQTKNQEAKASQERKVVEIYELGQHIQRCEADLVAKVTECEALQQRLQHQAKEQMTKLKQINMLEIEIRDYKRMSAGSTGNGSNNNSRSSSVNTMESVRSSTNPGEVAMLAQEEIKTLKRESSKKDTQIQDLLNKVARLESLSLQRASTASFMAAATNQNNSNKPWANQPQNNSGSGINSVGYDVSMEHQKLLVKYQALHLTQALASECIDALENENSELRVQLSGIHDLSPDTSVSTASANPITGLSPMSVKARYYPAAARLTPLDTSDATCSTPLMSSSTILSSSRSVQSNSSSSSSPSSTPNTATSPTSGSAPALTRKSSLRYSKDVSSLPLSPTTMAAVIAAGPPIPSA
ncbi:hypothetical protein BGW38_010167 [Lunasporangiospora selenospora]|uniref:Uncharacterized protein n=1 Tax=Lunasporangiospora selenospora TaxID=979761 RepID=A0A9P6KIZ3_9FUNG|nr:hypothetical protein BGW38_010167 [Lunasporangiospora selenospora]